MDFIFSVIGGEAPDGDDGDDDVAAGRRRVVPLVADLVVGMITG